MRRLIAPAAVVLLATACASSTKPAVAPEPSATAATASTMAPTQAPPATPSSPAPSQTSGAASSTPTAQTVVAVPSAQLPYKATAGAPPLGDVTITKTAAEPCGIPVDDGGNEVQLINAERVVTVISVTFEVTNPCVAALSYDITVTQAVGSAAGPTGGPAVQATTPIVQPGQSATFKVNIDPDPALTPTQMQQLWVGVTHIAKHTAR